MLLASKSKFFFFFISNRIFWHTTKHKLLLLTKCLPSKRNQATTKQKTRKIMLQVRLTYRHKALGINSVFLFRLGLSKRCLNIFTVKGDHWSVYKSNFHSTSILETKIRADFTTYTVSAYIVCFFSGEHKECSELSFQLS